MIKFKSFQERNLEGMGSVGKQLNRFFKENPNIQFLDVKFSCAFDPTVASDLGDVMSSCLLIYNEEETNDETA